MIRSLLAEFVRSPALAVRARLRVGALPLPADTRFTDEMDLAELRRRHPEWRAEPLAPVGVVQDPWMLPAEADASLACLVSFELFAAGDRLSDAFAAAARVLREDGVLVVPVDGESASGALSPEVADGVARLGARLGYAAPEAWNFELGAALIASQLPVYEGVFEFEFAGRIGLQHVYVLRRLGRPMREGELVQHEGAVYIVWGSLFRHVVSPEALALARRGGQEITPLSARAFARARLGRPFAIEDARMHGSAAT